MTVRMSDGKVEQVMDLAEITATGNIGPWLGFATDDSPTFTQRYRDPGYLRPRLGRALKSGDLGVLYKRGPESLRCQAFPIGF